MLDYPSIAAVAAVAREGTFERAATMLGMTPSAVSQRVRGLEERLGAILIRRGQPCKLTDLGRSLCSHFDRVRLLEQDLTPAFGWAGRQKDVSPALTVAVNADSLATWFGAAIAEFGRQTDVSVNLKLDDEAHTADRLRSGEVLAAVSTDPEPVQGCKTVELGSLRYVACASPEFMERNLGGTVNGASLSAAPHLGFDRQDVLQARWAREAHRCDLSAPAFWVPSTHGLCDLAIAGSGWVLLPLSMVEAQVASGRLVELPPGLRLDMKLYWIVARLQADALNQLTRAVCAAAVSVLRDK